MKPKFIALNLLLLAALAVIAWQGRERWNAAKARRQSHLRAAVRPVVNPSQKPAPKPDTAPAAKYLDVATKDLFSKDRNPSVVIDPPKVEQPKPMPPLPVVYGVMGLPSGTKAIMAETSKGAGRAVQVGDKVGEFEIAALDAENVTFDWNGKDISRKIDDLIDRSTVPQNSSPQPPAQAAAPAAGAPPPANPTPPSAPPSTAKDLGVETGAAGHSTRACTPGDPTPNGTIVDGYKKTITQTPFGAHCAWNQVK